LAKKFNHGIKEIIYGDIFTTVTNEKTVKESTLNTLLDRAPVLDWIATSYTLKCVFNG
jgi:hypothetical protein